MTLHKKTLIAIFMTLLALFVLLYVAANMILTRSYAQIEAHGVSTNIQRACSALGDDLSGLRSGALGWSKWDDVYHFVDDKNQAFIDNNLNDETFKDSDLNLMVFLNKQDELVYAKAYDLVNNVPMPLPSMLLSYLQAGDSLITHTKVNSIRQGYLSLPNGYMMIVSLPILTNLGQGPINGTLIWGRFLDQNLIKHLSDMMRLPVSFQPYDESVLSRAMLIDQQTFAPNMPKISYYMTPIDSTHMAGDTTIFDLYGKPIALLHLELTRTVHAQGEATLGYFLIALVIIGIVFSTVTIHQLDRNVLRRLSQLSTQVKHISTTSDLKTRINVTGTDELATLSKGLQSMLDSLDESRMQLQVANAKLKAANDNLELRVAARTADLTDAIELLRLEVADRRQTQELLAQAHEQALQALQLKTQILSNVSHDARTPLASIMLYAELLLRGNYGPVTDTQTQRLESVLTSARQLLGFINNLLGEAQLSSGNMTLQMHILSPRQLLREIGLVIIPLAERKELKMNIEVAPTVPSEIMGDENRLRQIITNLCDNAIKFTATGTVTIYLTTKASNQLVLTVKDTGRGIPPDALSRIFDAFWQVDGSSTRDVNRGVGLGLSIVKQLVTMMNGSINVESELGHGTTFTLQLPLMLPESMLEPSSVA